MRKGKILGRETQNHSTKVGGVVRTPPLLIPSASSFSRATGSTDVTMTTQIPELLLLTSRMKDREVMLRRKSGETQDSRIYRCPSACHLLHPAAALCPRPQQQLLLNTVPHSCESPVYPGVTHDFFFLLFFFPLVFVYSSLNIYP